MIAVILTAGFGQIRGCIIDREKELIDRAETADLLADALLDSVFVRDSHVESLQADTARLAAESDALVRSVVRSERLLRQSLAHNAEVRASFNALLLDENATPADVLVGCIEAIGSCDDALAANAVVIDTLKQANVACVAEVDTTRLLVAVRTEQLGFALERGDLQEARGDDLLSAYNSCTSRVFVERWKGRAEGFTAGSLGGLLAGWLIPNPFTE